MKMLHIIIAAFLLAACSDTRPQLPSFRLTSQHGGNYYCVGDDVEITWEAEPGIKQVTLYLTEPDSFRGIQTLSKEIVHKGKYVWKAGTVYDAKRDPFQDGHAYGFRIWVQYEEEVPSVTVPGSDLVISDGVFSVVHCEP